MKNLRHLLLLFFLCLAFPSWGSAQTVQLKDGKVFFAKEMRREGNFLFLKIATPDGALKDVAPTLLRMMGLPQPPEMTGRPLIDFV